MLYLNNGRIIQLQYRYSQLGASQKQPQSSAATAALKQFGVQCLAQGYISTRGHVVIALTHCEQYSHQAVGKKYAHFL